MLFDVFAPCVTEK